MSYKYHLRIILCLVVATILALTSHIYISEWSKPLVAAMTQDLKPYETNYSAINMFAAYGTAFITVGLLVFLYYQTNHLIPIKNKVLKALLVAVIILEIKGALFRQTFMDLLLNYEGGMPNPIKFVVVNQMDIWVANLLLALSLVYLCPNKKNALSSLRKDASS